MRTRVKRMLDYGIDEVRCKELLELAKCEDNQRILEMAAKASNDYLAQYLVISLQKKGVGFRSLFKDEVYLPCTEDDFYAYKRRTLALFDIFLKVEEVLLEDLRIAPKYP